GRWLVLAETKGRQTFSESRYGPQDTQQLDVQVRSSVRLVGSLAQLGARCRVPLGATQRASSSGAAAARAKRAGPTNRRFGGTRYARVGGGSRCQITGTLDTMRHAPCHGGSYRITRWVSRR